MNIEQLAIPDVWVCTPTIHGDDRGSFVEWFRVDQLAATTGRTLTIAQANHSTSARGVVRGVHFADVPPGQAKIVYCPVGAVLDVVVDLRVGSPTFGVVDSVVLDDVDRRTVLIPEGVGHAFCALRDQSSVTYLLSAAYDPKSEHAVSPLDPALAIPWPTDIELFLSEKDQSASTLAEALEQGVLPDFAQCQSWYAAQR